MEKFGTSRVTTAEMPALLQAISSITSIPVEELKKNLLGSCRTTAAGITPDSGDVDIAVENDKLESIRAKMGKVCGEQHRDNTGIGVYTFAVPVGDKKYQVDFMGSNNLDFTRWMYYSDLGGKSKYKGAYRNALLLAACSNKLLKDHDFELVINDQLIAKAGRSLKKNAGLERLFKRAKQKKDGTFNKTLEKVTPQELESFLQAIGHPQVFNPDPDIITDPDKIIEFALGKKVPHNKILTYEDCIKYIVDLPNADEVMKDAAREIESYKLPLPPELKKYSREV